ncbi:MAG: Ribosome-recycling factor [Candidatus Magasanikbacteria bacterium GW2011_GWA2_56_11]|uniref:Ribosome-recycling factor n=1 Tax=Candidatus Magasanikbacteria bacterium GW2011_GWA2_56_11 TaxID=1619044 RepID=A0A0G2BBT5_9BACT|nr:MAG: Ribosome-recycling factor [Candidatus Magasanikbacteria bacterium GW2011_GWA2_56_11]
MNIVQQNKAQFDAAIDHLRHDISSLRTGRATPALVEDVLIEAYGTKQPLKAVASISVADAKTLAIEPWDKSLTPAIEAGLRSSSLGISPVNDGKAIRLPLPSLTQERRAELIKVLHQKLEQARIALRKIREDIRREIDQAETDSTIGEDQKFKMNDEVEKLVKDYNEKIKTIGEEKEVEITTI